MCDPECMFQYVTSNADLAEALCRCVELYYDTAALCDGGALRTAFEAGLRASRRQARETASACSADAARTTLNMLANATMPLLNSVGTGLGGGDGDTEDSGTSWIQFPPSSAEPLSCSDTSELPSDASGLSAAEVELPFTLPPFPLDVEQGLRPPPESGEFA